MISVFGTGVKQSVDFHANSPKSYHSRIEQAKTKLAKCNLLSEAYEDYEEGLQQGGEISRLKAEGLWGDEGPEP